MNRCRVRGKASSRCCLALRESTESGNQDGLELNAFSARGFLSRVAVGCILPRGLGQHQADKRQAAN